MNYSLSNMLGRRMALASLDPSAKGYIDAVVAAGGTVSGGQKSAINTFVKTGKSEGWYSSLKRLYLPIWGVAAPNAIDMIGLTSGTFVGGVTHSSGYVTGNGLTGYFDTGVDPVTLGHTNATGLLLALTYISSVQTSGGMFSCAELLGANPITSLQLGSNETVGHLHQISGRLRYTEPGGAADRVGIYTVSRTATNAIEMRRRRTAGAIQLVSGTSTTVAASTRNLYAMASNYATIASIFNSSSFGLYGAGLGMSSTTQDQLSASLKTMWEGATGLTLP
jgi:hypothetical protein